MGKRSREKKKKKNLIWNRKRKTSETGNQYFEIIFAGTCLILFAPFIISSKYFFPFVGLKSIYFMALVEIIFAAWVILMIFTPKYRPHLNALLLILTVFLASQIVSSVFGVDFSRSFWSKYERMTGLLMQFHLFAFFLVISSTFREKKDWLRIFGVSVFASVLMSFVNLLSTHGINVLGEMSSATRGGATIGNSSFLGTYLLFNFYLSLYLVFNVKGFLKLISIFGLAIIGMALIFSTARAALVSTLGGAIILLLLWLIFNKRRQLKLIGIFIAVSSLIFLIIFTIFAFQSGNFIHDGLMELLRKNFGETAQTLGGRLIVWKSAWEGFFARPFFGWGPENFEIVFTSYYNPCLGTAECASDVWYDRAHNIIFDTLVTTGAIGLLSYLSIFAVVFFVLFRKFLKDYISFWAAGIFSVVLIAYFIQNLTVFDMVNSYILFFLVLGFIGSIASESIETDKREKPINFWLVAVVVILFLISFTKFIIQPAEADRYTIVSLGYPLGSQEKLDAYEKTLSISSLGSYQIRDFFSQSTLESVQNENSANIPQANIKRELDFLIQEMEKSIVESPLDFRSYLKLGQLYNTYAVLFDPTKLSRAEEVLKGAIEVSPTNQQGYWALAQTKIYQGDFGETLSLVEKALSLEPKSKQSNLIVIQVAKMMGNMDLARQKATEALKIDPSLETDINSILGE